MSSSGLGSQGVCETVPSRVRPAALLLRLAAQSIGAARVVQFSGVADFNDVLRPAVLGTSPSSSSRGHYFRLQARGTIPICMYPAIYVCIQQYTYPAIYVCRSNGAVAQSVVLRRRPLLRPARSPRKVVRPLRIRRWRPLLRVAPYATSGAHGCSLDALQADSDLRANGPCHRRDGTAGTPEPIYFCYRRRALPLSVTTAGRPEAAGGWTSLLPQEPARLA